MADDTRISWCDATHNHWIGCTKVSVACENCYAEALMDTRFGRVKWGPGEPRILTSKANRNKPRTWDRRAAANGTRPFVFCNSLSDVFDNEVDPAWRKELIELWWDTPHLIWLPLTKRIGNVLRMVNETGLGWPPNAALGATIVNQAEWNRDYWRLDRAARHLFSAFTFVSYEPADGPLDITTDNGPGVQRPRAPDWLLVGGKSGPNGEAMPLDWARDLRRQCGATGTVFHFKQVGGRDKDHGGHLLDGVAYLDRPQVRERA